MSHCPTCGQLIADHRDADWLLNVLTNSVPHCEVYRGRDGGWWLTRGHGGGKEVPADSVRALVRRGAIVSVYSDWPDDAFHVGRTLDTKRTMEERKRQRNRSIMIYVEQANAGSVR